MSMLDEVRTRFALAKDKAPFGSLQEVRQELSEALTELQGAAQGSTNEQITQAVQQFQASLDHVDQAHQRLRAAIEALESYETLL